ncbi:MBL fold metallo-hydrolase [Amycolatopsis halotolerans]|uniref:MBL fold metallo-hydrolase n=1 Tax=Amycolatopsis halotolerans TaxID=330083 RepID=A0ABV7Q8R2_9PSEU
MHITHLGHACVLVDTGSARLLIDPGVMSDLDGVDSVDAVLLTHKHPDHVDPEKVRAVLATSPRAVLAAPADIGEAMSGLPEHRSAEPGRTLKFGDTVVDVVGGRHAPVHETIPSCANLGYLIDGGAFFHPGDSFHEPAVEVGVLAVAIDGPWLKIAESIDYVRRVAPRVAIPIHEGETLDPAKYVGMLSNAVGGGVVRRLERGSATRL